VHLRDYQALVPEMERILGAVGAVLKKRICRRAGVLSMGLTGRHLNRAKTGRQAPARGVVASLSPPSPLGRGPRRRRPRLSQYRWDGATWSSRNDWRP
jgi:hypothetical protein